MIDDNPDNVAGALAVGISGLLFQSYGRLRPFLIEAPLGNHPE
jgi:hypothetical protein